MVKICSFFKQKLKKSSQAVLISLPFLPSSRPPSLPPSLPMTSIRDSHQVPRGALGDRNHVQRSDAEGVAGLVRREGGREGGGREGGS